MSKLTEKDYEAMADDYETHPVRADEATEFEISDVVLRKGRPVGEPRGATLPVRFPDEVRDKFDARVCKDGTAASELIRRAV